MQPRRLSTGQSYTATGAMTSKINILKRSARRDANGEFLAADVFAANVWARIQTLTSKYTDRPQQVLTEATQKIIIRYMAGVTSAMTIQEVSSGTVYNIESANDPDGKRMELWLMCYKRNDGRVPA